MAVKENLTGKHLQISKANSTMVVAVAVSAFIVVFSLVACKALIDKRSYKSRVIEKKKTALNQLKSNNEAAEVLVASYQQFVSQPENIIGGKADGDNKDKDGDNAKIILDALPSKYDFPAVASSLEKILDDRNYSVNSISGNDDEINQQAQTAESGPISMPFDLDVTGKYKSIEELVKFLEQSIRPLRINQLGFEGSDDELTITISGTTYYQPAKSLEIKKEVVK